MKIISEIYLHEFDFWSGAKDTVKYLTDDEIDMMEEYIDPEGEGVEETTINDFFWFEDDYIAEILGYASFEELMEDRG